jgi:hypothetical protein
VLLKTVGVGVKELRAVAIEYAWSKPHRLEAVEGVTIGRTWSVQQRPEPPDPTSRDHLLWTAVARNAALNGEAAERYGVVMGDSRVSFFGL